MDKKFEKHDKNLFPNIQAPSILFENSNANQKYFLKIVNKYKKVNNKNIDVLNHINQIRYSHYS